MEQVADQKAESDQGLIKPLIFKDESNIVILIQLRLEGKRLAFGGGFRPPFFVVAISAPTHRFPMFEGGAKTYAE